MEIPLDAEFALGHHPTVAYYQPELEVFLRRAALVQQICDPERPVTYVVGHGDYRRWEFQLQPAESRDGIATDERVWELLEPWITPDDAELVRAVVYQFHATVADAMRSGRVFLTGDAAHQMPPFLGQGLCSGAPTPPTWRGSCASSPMRSQASRCSTRTAPNDCLTLLVWSPTRSTPAA